MRRIIAVFLSLIMILSTTTSVFAADSLNDTINNTASYLTKTVANPQVGSIGGEWAVIGLSRSGVKVPDGYFENYYANVLDYVKAKDGVLHSKKYTEYSRVILALTAIGKNPKDVAGYDLTMLLLDYDKTIWQGINGPVWALIALDSRNYGTTEIREKYINHILEREKQNGGWSLSDSETDADCDITAMALIALSNYKDDERVSLAIDRALRLLSSMQNDNGGYAAYNTATSESCAQVLTAISALGISYTDERFVKNGNTLVDNIMSFYHSDGSFSHTDSSNLMATEQCFYSLVAAKRLAENKNMLYNMGDVKGVGDSEDDGLPGKNANVSVSEVKYPDKTFVDIQNHKNQGAIEELSKRGIINGMNENSFAPDNTMTRAEFACITVKALGLPIKSTPKFNDVTSNDWHYDFVNTAYNFGIVNGVSDTLFNPNGTITREEAFTMVARAAKLCGMEIEIDEVTVRNVLAEFIDYVRVSDWAKTSVAFCFENGISDRSVLEIKPFEAVKRCEIAQMIYNMLKGARLI